MGKETYTPSNFGYGYRVHVRYKNETEIRTFRAKATAVSSVLMTALMEPPMSGVMEPL